ncbi:MAG: outer membrane beta-barrel protein [Candidatus Erginobacter occultus]|nr:outer membrane beta-barrel protein [Candidatus Erginobacter occultus]
MKRVEALIFSVAMVLAFGTAAMAQVGLDLHGIYAFEFSDDDIAELDGAFGGGASLVFCLGDFVKLDLGGDWYKPEFKDFSDVKIELIPVTGTLRIGIPIEDVAFIYGGGGAGYTFINWDQTGVDSDVLDGSVTYHACGGAEILFNESIGIRAEFRYIWLKPEWKDSNDKVELNHMQARGGLVLYF